MLGTSPYSLAAGSIYVDSGATASDNVDGDMTASIATVSNVNTTVVGSYTVTYNVSDAAGNAATQVTRTVTVVDNIVPVITMLGTSPYSLAVGSIYVDSGATASDNVDGDMTASIATVSNVDTAVVGSYTVTYNVSDAAGNAATQVSRVVNVVAAPTVFSGKLNDTGITTCANATTNGLACPQVGFPGQDAELGRDAYAGLVKTGGGSAAFDFTKLDAAGAALTNQAVLYANTPWDCVQDHVTGLMWEVKTTGGAGGLRDANHTYTWLNSDPYINGGAAGTANGGICVDAVNCDTEKYVAAVNVAGLCGFNDWRLPKVEELRSIVDYIIPFPGPTIDTAYFPNAIGSWYWSSSSYAAGATGAWGVGFFNGGDGAYFKSYNGYVRLVRGGQ